jgi:hypothetical protein
MNATEPVIATGHQPYLWHPGILAKDMAATRAASLHAAQTLHVVVDHDTQPALQLEVPRQSEHRLWRDRLALSAAYHAVPAGFQPPVEVGAAIENLRRQASVVSLQPIMDAFSDLPACNTLAEQMAVVLDRLKQPLVGRQPILFVSDLPKLAAYRGLIEQMRCDARRCALAYNRAVAQVPEAGVPPLAITPEWVEMPLWACAWAQPRRRVFVDVTAEPAAFVLSNGDFVDPKVHALLPRALTLSAVLRGYVGDWFIHGRGGGVYDRATEQWWHQWQNERLNPMAVVSADLRLQFDAPLADRQEVAQARWLAHHRRHNLDRWLDLEGPLVHEKRRLIEAIQTSQDRWFRWLGFCAIHRINAALAKQHPDAMRRLEDKQRNAEAGLVNQAIAAKRDWCFALYDRSRLNELADRLAMDDSNAR